MKIKKFLNWQIILLAVIVLSMLTAINPRLSSEGVVVKSASGAAYDAGLRAGDIVTAVNKIEVNSPEEFVNAINQFSDFKPKEIAVETSVEKTTYTIVDSLGFKTRNLTIISVEKDIPLEINSTLISINNQKVTSDELQKLAISEGMTTMLQDGIDKVSSGLTTIEEVVRVVRES